MSSTAFLSKVSFVNKISTLMKATSNNDTPVPGYLYKEISNITLESVVNCENTLDFLVERLAEKSCHVKLKVLKIMRYLVENGHVNFRLGLLKKSRGIKEATKFNGPPDPLHGNVPYRIVRSTAQELSEILFNIEAEGIDTVHHADSRTSTAGHGVSSLSSSSSNSGSRMEGFGNTSSQHSKSLGDNIKEGIIKMAVNLGDTTADQQRALLSKIESKSDYRPPPVMNSTSVEVTPSQHLSTQPRESCPHITVPHPKHIPGRAGGGWEDDDEDFRPDATNLDIKSSHKSRSRSSGSVSAGLEEQLENVTVEDWQTEETLVKSFTENMDTPLLKRSQIASFITECASVNCDKVVEFLNTCLSSSDHHILMRTMLLIEGLITSDLLTLERLTSVCRDNLVVLFKSNDGPPQAKARKIIRILEKLTSQKDILSLSSQKSLPTHTDMLIEVDSNVV